MKRKSHDITSPSFSSISVGKRGKIIRGNRKNTNVIVLEDNDKMLLVKSIDTNIEFMCNKNNFEVVEIESINLDDNNITSNKEKIESTSPYSRNDGKINFQKELEDHDLLCCVCWDPLTSKIYQCLLGAHNVCENCRDNIRNSGKNACPLDRTPGGFIPNPRLEKEVALLTVPCVYSGCTSKILPWMLDDHTIECEHAPFKCPLCDEVVNTQETNINANYGPFGTHLLSKCHSPCVYLVPAVSTSSHTYILPTVSDDDKTSFFIRIDDYNYIIMKHLSSFAESHTIKGQTLPSQQVDIYNMLAINLTRKKYSNPRNFKLLYIPDYVPIAPQSVTVQAENSSISQNNSASEPSFPQHVASLARRMMFSFSQQATSPSLSSAVITVSSSPHQQFSSFPSNPSFLSIDGQGQHQNNNAQPPTGQQIAVNAKKKHKHFQSIQVPCTKYGDDIIKSSYLTIQRSNKVQYLTVTNAFNVGDLLDSLDTRNMWLEAVVVSIKDDMILIHYPQWSTKWDCLIDMDSETIAPHRTHTLGPNYNPNYGGN